MQKDVFLDYDKNENDGVDMGGDSSHKKSQRNGLVWLPPNALPGEDRLSPFGKVAVGADRKCGRPPRYHEGMSLEDAVIITGLPRDEAARRIRRMKADKNPDIFAQTDLAIGAGEDYLAKMQNQAVTGRPPVCEAEIAPTPLEMIERPSAKILNFPLPYSAETRAVSNPLARCALFAAVKERQFFREYETIGVVNGALIEFSGEQLNQDDHDTFLQLIKMALHHPYGVEIVQAVNAVLTGLGRHTHQEQRSQLFEQISRLVRGTLRITLPDGLRYEGHLLDDATTPDDQKVLPRLRRHLAYRLNPKFSFLYDRTSFSLFDWEQRLKIKGRGSELAKWLHLWIISNAEQYPHKVETIKERCGSRIKDLKFFRRSLRAALDLLKVAGVITAWHIDAADLVHIERTPSAAQLEHLNNRATKTPKQPRE